MSWWRVEVMKGLAVVPEEGVPMTFGAKQVTLLEEGGLSEPTVNLVYDPIGLRIEGGSAWLWVQRDRGSRNVRWMDHVTTVEIDWSGELRIFGMEAREDGVMVTALWICVPHEVTDEERAELSRIFGGEG